MDVDEALLSVGEFGWCQKRLTGFLILLQVYVACQSMLIVIVGAIPDYHIVIEAASADRDIITHIRFSDNFTSIVSEWHLIQHEAYKVNLASSLLFAGLLIGNILFGPLSDKLGRRPVYLTGLFFDVIFGYLTALAPSYEVFAVSRFFVGIMNGGMALVSFVLTQEYVGKSYWALTGSLTNLTFAVGIALYALLGYYIRNWRILAFLANSPGVLFFLLSFLLPESPRWLYSRGYIAEAEAVLHCIARGNGKEIPSVKLKESNTTPGPGDSAHSVFDLVRYGVLLRRTIILMYIWYVCSLVYYGLTLNAGELKGNLYMNVALYGLIEVPAFPLCLFFIEKSWSGRRKSTSGFLVFAGLACIFTMFLPDNTYKMTAMRPDITSQLMTGYLSSSMGGAIAWWERDQSATNCIFATSVGTLIETHRSFEWMQLIYVSMGGLADVWGEENRMMGFVSKEGNSNRKCQFTK